MASDKPPLVLLHPFLLSGNVWQDVVPLRTSYHQVYTRPRSVIAAGRW